MTAILIYRHVSYIHNLQAIDPLATKRIQFIIEPGSSVRTIASKLESEELIRNSNAFVRYIIKNELDQNIQAGQFILQPSMNVAEIATALQTGIVPEIAITIPEGYTINGIDALLTTKKLIRAGEFMRCAQTCNVQEFTFLPDTTDWLPRAGKVEGYLFPDTYFVATANFDPEEFLHRLLQTFEQKVVPKVAADLKQQGMTLTELISMAAMVEKESRLPAEKPIVAGILWKRLDEGISLGVDATVRYMANNPTGGITVSDLQTDSPYNTRKYRGLPPGPIANPGLGTILSTLNAEDSPYYYYLHGADGKIRYARTNDEHNVNKAKYL